MTNLLAKYMNGNYTVKLFDNGTKVRFNRLDHFKPDFAESIDCTITNKCDGRCQWCYMGCTENGIHGDLNDPIFDTLHAGTELALNANDLTHPQLEDFLVRMHDKDIICNLTINQKHLKQNLVKLKNWQSRQLVWGIGISLTDSTDPILYDNGLKNTVIHVIDGCFTKQDLENLKNKPITLLILGFKIKGRGESYYAQHQKEVDANIQFLKEHLYDYKPYYNGFAFDTLAFKHLDIRSKISDEAWSRYHMGEEGEFTFFIDLVHRQFAISSLETEMWPILDSVDEMFKVVRKNACHG